MLSPEMLKSQIPMGGGGVGLVTNLDKSSSKSSPELKFPFRGGVGGGRK